MGNWQLFCGCITLPFAPLLLLLTHTSLPQDARSPGASAPLNTFLLPHLYLDTDLLPQLHPDTDLLPQLHPDIDLLPQLHLDTVLLPQLHPDTALLPQLHPDTVLLPQLHPATSYLVVNTLRFLVSSGLPAC